MFALILLLLALILLPGLWVRRVMRQHSGHRPDFRGDGAAFARHLLAEQGLQDVGVEVTDRGDHYDPSARMVRLSPENHAGRSLTAITVAAHEVGHAIQHHYGLGGLSTRTALVGWAIRAERLGGMLMLAIPLLLILTRTPMSGALMLVGGLLAFGAAALVHLVTLPVEWDASFRRAMPLLANGYLDTEDLAAARQILLAAALTYVGASLLAILNVWRWLAVLRR
ncbi:MAG: zinc metallopeptidase [Xanthomonadales bacterium]|jgi:hypothetical protein|nr:zinc metallopeptidase [Xanthomonadales bacterium]